MTAEQQEMLAVAIGAQARGFKTVLIGSDDVIALLRRVQELEARVEEMRRKYEPTADERGDDMDAMAGACWG